METVGTREINIDNRSYLRNNKKIPGSDLLSHTVASAVPSAKEGLASVFGMRTGVAPPLWLPGNLPIAASRNRLIPQMRL